MDAVRLEALKAYMRVTGTADDACITAMYEAAVEYLTDAGIRRGAKNGARYDLAVNAMVLHWFDHRGEVEADGALCEIPMGLRTLINQMKLTRL